MRRFLGHLTWAVSMGVLLASIGASEVKAADTYQIAVTIVDTTTNTTTAFAPILSTSALNTSVNPDQIVVSAAFNTSATGVSITGLQSTTTSNAAFTQLGIQATATVQGASTDSYTVTIVTSHDQYNLPVGPAAMLGQSQSGTYTFTNAGNTQAFNSWYNPGSALGVTTGPNPGTQTINIPAAGQFPNSASSPTATTTFSPFLQPYTLTNRIILNIKGNGNVVTPNSIASFQGSTTIMAVPEPASLVMFLTGLPMPLMVLGMLRRRKAQRKTDLVA
jgi:hypothetical protein